METLLSIESRATAKKSVKLVWQCHQLLSGFLAKGLLPRISRQSRLSTNDKSDNEMIPGAEHRSPAIYLRAEEFKVAFYKRIPINSILGSIPPTSHNDTHLCRNYCNTALSITTSYVPSSVTLQIRILKLILSSLILVKCPLLKISRFNLPTYIR